MASALISSLASKFAVDLYWNYAALGLMAVSGVLLNIIVLDGYQVSGLGVFNQIYAVYVIASQLAVGGIHLSALKHVAEFHDDPAKVAAIFWSAMAMVVGLGLLCGLGLLAASGWMGRMLGSQMVGAGLALAAPGITLFAINKVLLGVLNGMRLMRFFALGQASRYVFLIIFTVAASHYQWPVRMLGAAFTVAEALVLVMLLAMLLPRLACSLAGLAPWIRRHAIFGIKGFMSWMLLEVNARVDVLMVGLLLSDSAVGVYSFAAMFMEGFQALLGVVRNNINPILVRLVKQGEVERIRRMQAKTMLLVYPGMLVILAAFLWLYEPLVGLLPQGNQVMDSLPILTVLFVGLFFYSGFAPFNAILIQAGQPGWNTWLITCAVLTNIILNALLIPGLGIIGAAWGTAVALGLFVVYLLVFVKRRLGFFLVGPAGDGRSGGGQTA